MGGELTTGPSPYELEALDRVEAWKNKGAGPVGRVGAALGKPVVRQLERLTGRLRPLKSLDWIVEKTVGPLISILGGAARWTVNRKRILANYRKLGLEVHRREDVFGLDLSEVDRVSAGFKTKYAGLAGVEGAAAGLAGLAGIPADVIALVALSQRAVAEYAAVHGFDLSDPAERLYAMNVLALASNPDTDERRVAAAHMTRLAKKVARRKLSSGWEGRMYSGLIQRLAQTLGLRLSRAKAAQIVPVVGALAAGGLNARYVSQVCDAAAHLYRERFLARKYGWDLEGDDSAGDEPELDDLDTEVDAGLD